MKRGARKKGAEARSGATFSSGVWCAEDVLGYAPTMPRAEAEKLAVQANTFRDMTWKKLRELVELATGTHVEKPTIPLAVVAKKPQEAAQEVPPMATTKTETMSSQEVADFAGVDQRKVRRDTRSGKLPSKKNDSNEYTFKRADVEAWKKTLGQKSAKAEKPARITTGKERGKAVTAAIAAKKSGFHPDPKPSAKKAAAKKSGKTASAKVTNITELAQFFPADDGKPAAASK